MKKKIRSYLALILVACLLMSQFDLMPAYAVNSTTVKVYPDKQYQTMEGWGTSLSWWGNIVGNWTTSKKTELMNLMFNQTTGLGLNVIRYNIGGGENPTHNHMRTGAEIPGYETSSGVWDWTADAGQRWVMTQAKDLGANIFEAFSNSPPYWMTNSQCSAGSTDGYNNLPSTQFNAFADYLVEVVDHFKNNWGITFDTLAPFNEPISTWWVNTNNQEGCHFDLTDQNTLINTIGQKLANKGLSTKISAPDEYSSDQAVDSVAGYNSTAKSYINQYNVHGYAGTFGTSLYRTAKNDNKKISVSEATFGVSNTQDLTAIDASLLLAKGINKDLETTRPSQWVYWQPVEDFEGYNTYGLMKANFSGTESYTISKQYYAFGNYTKFIKPGYKILESYDPVNSLVAYDSSSGKLIIVVVNDTSSSKSITYDLTGFSSVTGTVTPYRTSSTENLSQLSSISVSNKTFTAAANANSVTTYVISGVTYNGSVNSTNYISNGNFDSNGTTLSPWVAGGDSGTGYIEADGYTGNRLAQYKSSAYSSYTYQIATVPNGKYRLKAKVTSSGGQTTAQMQIKNYGGSQVNCDIPTTNSWTEISIDNINVTNGSIEVGFYSNAPAGKWINVDDVVLEKISTANYICNGDFDLNGLNGNPWVFGGGTAGYLETGGVDGNRMAQYSGSAYNSYTYQMNKNIPNGTYTLKAKVMSSGEQYTAQMQFKNYGGSQVNVDIPTASTWTEISIDRVNVTNGQIEVGFYSNAPAGKWINVDDVRLYNVY